MRPDLLHILQRALGADRLGRGGGKRNSYPAGEDVKQCQLLVALGLMEQRGEAFEVTSQGMAEMLLQSPEPTKRERSNAA